MHNASAERRMNTVLSLSPAILRIGLVPLGIAMLWFGMSQISVTGLGLMLVGLMALVGAISLPWPSLRLVHRPLNLARVTNRPRRPS